MRVSDGDVKTALAEAEHVVGGDCRVGGQDHFYLETHACLVVPKGEGEEIEIVCTSQGVSHTQTYAAMALGVPQNKIVCRVKRIGTCTMFLY